jgi:hypothetical protein
LKDEQANAMFEERLLELLDSVWVEDDINDEIDRMEALLETELGNDDLSQAIDDLRIFVYLQRAALEDALPAKADDLGPAGCLVARGSVNATFETTWGSSETSVDWTSEGTLDLSIDWYGDDVPIFGGGVVAGNAEEAYGLLAFIAPLDAAYSTFLLPYFVFNPEQITEGELHSFDDTMTGYLLYTEPAYGGEWGMIAYMGDGTVQFDSLEASPSGSIAGTLSTTVYVWEEAD